jgi:curved DNA-binding protein
MAQVGNAAAGRFGMAWRPPRGPPVSVPDPYKVLQVDPDADREVIESAYKRLARKYHPDVSTEPNAVARMVQINQAWDLLRDPVRRASVDRARARSAATSARVVAADARDHAAARGRSAPPPAGGGSGGAGGWPFPGMQEPSTGSFGPRGEHVSSSWTSGRSTEGYRYDAGTMGSGAAGPPPGNPSGSIVSFGRYQGWTLGEIARTDLEYLEWLDRMPIGRTYQAEIDMLLRKHGRRVTATADEGRGRGLFRRR